MLNEQQLKGSKVLRGSPPQIMPGLQQIIENAMRQDDETPTTQIQAIMASYCIVFMLL